MSLYDAISYKTVLGLHDQPKNQTPTSVLAIDVVQSRVRKSKRVSTMFNRVNHELTLIEIRCGAGYLAVGHEGNIQTVSDR